MTTKLIAILAAMILVTSCSTLDGTRDRIAGFVETDERANAPDRIRLVPEYVRIPDEYLGVDACPPPVQLTPQEIARMTSEGDYNELFVAPLYANNEQCYLNNQRIQRFNDNQVRINRQTRDNLDKQREDND